MFRHRQVPMRRVRDDTEQKQREGVLDVEFEGRMGKGVAMFDEFFRVQPLRVCFKIPWGLVFAEKARWRGATPKHTFKRSAIEEQRSQQAFSAKILRAAGLLSGAGVGSTLTVRCGDAPASPPWPQP